MVAELGVFVAAAAVVAEPPAGLLGPGLGDLAEGGGGGGGAPIQTGARRRRLDRPGDGEQRRRRAGCAAAGERHLAEQRAGKEAGLRYYAAAAAPSPFPPPRAGGAKKNKAALCAQGGEAAAAGGNAIAKVERWERGRVCCVRARARVTFTGPPESPGETVRSPGGARILQGSRRLAAQGRNSHLPPVLTQQPEPGLLAAGPTGPGLAGHT